MGSKINKESVSHLLTKTKFFAILGIILLILGLILPCFSLNATTKSALREIGINSTSGISFNIQGIDSWEGQIILCLILLNILVLASNVLEIGSEKMFRIFKKLDDKRCTLLITIVSTIFLVLFAVFTKNYHVNVGYIFMCLGEICMIVFCILYKRKGKASIDSEDIER